MAHIEGGEWSLGALDQQVRDALTQMSLVHLAPTEAAAVRLRAIGADPDAIVVTGAPSLDHLKWSTLPPLETVETQIGLSLRQSPVVVSMHPTTMRACSTDELPPLMTALHDVTAPIVFCFPNADAGYERIVDSATSFCYGRENAVIITHLDHLSYWTLLKNAAVLVGNSSSGIMEAPSLGLPVVNVGERQKGRTRSPNIIDVKADASSIASAIAVAMSDDFIQVAAQTISPYGDGDAGTRIADAIAAWSPS
jgi:UDP-N-acetylglucosamine 2-epimerase (non-hydrolysing)/GDP/UDP-N,N'-diacetylbacillosamine 2-epimerase (hydrolysing)